MIACEAWLYRQNLQSMQEGQIVALDDRLEFQRAHLNSPEDAFESGYRAGPSTGYSMGFEGQEGYVEPGFDNPWQAWGE